MATVVLTLLGSPATAGNQGGRRTAINSTWDGTGANIAGNSFNPDSGHCLVFSVLVYNETNSRMLQDGVVRCNGANLDGTCAGVKFVEKYDGSTYTCYPHGSFNTGSLYYFNVKRETASSNCFASHIGAAQTEYERICGFYSDDDIRFYAWGERTGSGTGCAGWSGSGEFDGWQRFKYGSGWTYLTGARFNPTDCWTISDVNNTGDFNVVE